MRFYLEGGPLDGGWIEDHPLLDGRTPRHIGVPVEHDSSKRYWYDYQRTTEDGRPVYTYAMTTYREI